MTGSPLPQGLVLENSCRSSWPVQGTVGPTGAQDIRNQASARCEGTLLRSKIILVMD